MGRPARVEASFYTVRPDPDGREVRYGLRVAGLVVVREDASEVVGAIEVLQSEPDVGVLSTSEEQFASEKLIEAHARDVLHEPDWQTTKAMVQKLVAPIPVAPGDRHFAVVSHRLWETAARIGWKALVAIYEHCDAAVYRRAVLGEEHTGEAAAR